ncbi:MAG: adenylate/guanylate cyclase domain-containing protein [Spirochaetaceae bacterium]
MKKMIYRGLIIALFSVLISSAIWLLNIIEPFERISWDARVKSFVDDTYKPNNIVVIMLDQDSLDWAEDEQGWSWPWPREVLTTLINFASRNGAKTIAFDVVYTEASLYSVYDDEAFGYAIDDSDIFIGACLLDETGENSWNTELPDQEIIIEGLEEWLKLDSTDIVINGHLTYPIPEVSKYSSRLANVRAKPDDDGIYRSADLFYIYNDRIFPSIALASYLTGSDSKSQISIKKGLLTIDGKQIPINNQGQVILNYKTESDNFTKIKAAKIINSEIQYISGEDITFDSSVFNDAYVMFGYAATGLLDLRATPLSGNDTGVMVHAVTLDNLINNQYVKKLNPIISILITLLLSIVAGILYTRFQGGVKSVLFYILFIALPIIISVIYYFTGIWFPLIFVELSVLLTLIIAGLVNYATEGKQKRFIKSAFKQYLSPDFIEHILTDPDKLKLGGEKKEISIFFSDLEGFTTISEGLTPEELTKLINEYLTAMTDIILDEGGTIDKYEGDAIIAFWNAPIDYPDHAIRSVRAALRCQDKLKEMRPYFFNNVGHNLFMRIGINTGDAVVGNMGSNTRFDYTMLGDAVNLAARLEGINKQFGTYTMISEKTKLEINSFYPSRELGKVTVVGKNKAITVFEPMLQEEYSNRENDLNKFNLGLDEFYNGRFNEAINIFESINDPAAKKYIDKCRELNKTSTENWDGVWKMTQK